MTGKDNDILDDFKWLLDLNLDRLNKLEEDTEGSTYQCSGSQPGVSVPPGVSEKPEGVSKTFKVVNENAIKYPLYPLTKVYVNLIYPA